MPEKKWQFHQNHQGINQPNYCYQTSEYTWSIGTSWESIVQTQADLPLSDEAISAIEALRVAGIVELIQKTLKSRDLLSLDYALLPQLFVPLTTSNFSQN